MARRRKSRSTGTELLAATLARLGVARAHGGPTAVLLAESLSGHGVAFVESATPLSALLAAVGEARVTGSVGVVLLASRAALVAALPGIASARADGTRLLAVVIESFPPRVRELDPEMLLRPLVEHVGKVSEPAALGPELLAAARATSLPCAGPAALVVPATLLEGDAEIEPAEPVSTEPSPVRPGDEDVAAIVTALRRASSVGIYAGQGAFGAGGRLAALAEKLEAPVASTISGRGVLSDDHPLSVGFGFGGAALPYVRKIFEERELVLAIGAGFSEAAVAGGMPLPRTLVHVDARPSQLHPQAKLAIAADAHGMLEALVDAVPAARRSAALRDAIARGKRAHVASLTRAPQEEGVQPELFFARLRSRLPKDAVLALDPGEPMFWALHAFEVYRPRTLLMGVDLPFQGSAVPAAIGALLAAPGRIVVAVTSASPALGLELSLATERHLPLPTFVFDPAGDIPPGKEGRRGRLASRRLDLRALAQAVGARSVRISSDFDLDAGLDAALAAADRPTVVQVRILDDRVSPYTRALLAAGSRSLSTRMRTFARAFAARILRDS